MTISPSTSLEVVAVSASWVMRPTMITSSCILTIRQWIIRNKEVLMVHLLSLKDHQSRLWCRSAYESIQQHHRWADQVLLNLWGRSEIAESNAYIRFVRTSSHTCSGLGCFDCFVASNLTSNSQARVRLASGSFRGPTNDTFTVLCAIIELDSSSLMSVVGLEENCLGNFDLSIWAVINVPPSCVMAFRVFGFSFALSSCWNCFLASLTVSIVTGINPERDATGVKLIDWILYMRSSADFSYNRHIDAPVRVSWVVEVREIKRIEKPTLFCEFLVQRNAITAKNALDRGRIHVQ